MKFSPLKITGALLIEIEPFQDERGLFARTYCHEEFSRIGITFNLSQSSTSFNVNTGTLRGMHFQREPFAEKKLVRCTSGAIFDVILDLRPKSKTYLQWEAIELTAMNRKSIYIPEGVAHGFQTLEANSEILYQMNVAYHADYYAGVRWNDPLFNIKWPTCSERIISMKDANYPDYSK